MLIIALVLALIGLLALVFAVVTSNQLVAWVCIGASVLGVALLIVDALRERQQGGADEADGAGETGVAEEADVDYPEEAPEESQAVDAGVIGSEEPSEEASEATEESAGIGGPKRRQRQVGSSATPTSVGASWEVIGWFVAQLRI